MATDRRHCASGGCLPAAPDRVPDLDCERGLYELGVGCNQLRCPECHQLARPDDDGVWRCACLDRRTDHTIYLGRQERGYQAPPELPWRCAGHPVPGPDDLAVRGWTDDPIADVREQLTAPPLPHSPKGHPGYAVDVRLDFAEAMGVGFDGVRQVLVDALDGEDDVVTHRAMAVLFHRRQVPLQGAAFRWKRLEGRMKPGSSVLTLGRVWAEGIARLAREAGEGSEAWEEARSLRQLGAGGRNGLLWSLFPDG